jgi:hypothetical protein
LHIRSALGKLVARVCSIDSRWLSAGDCETRGLGSRQEESMERQDPGRVIYEKDGAISRLIMNWSEKANLQDSEMVAPPPAER